MSGMESGRYIERRVTFTAESFCKFKDYQRIKELEEGRRLTNSEALSLMILESRIEIDPQKAYNALTKGSGVACNE